METDEVIGARIPKRWFGVYLRTGATPWHENPVDTVETKFNPWHDPANGQFTFADQGIIVNGRRPKTAPTSKAKRPPPRQNVSRSWTGGGFTGGGGGSGGGGGAFGSWGPATPRQDLTPTQTEHRPQAHPAIIRAAAALAVASEPQYRIITRNGYSFRLDATGRMTLVTGTLTSNPDQQRSRTAQARAGGPDRLLDDDGGHYIARRFNGPTDEFNHFAQNANFNRGGYKSLEDRWAKAVKAGKRIFVQIKATYQGTSKRPANISVVYTIDGRSDIETFPNAAKGKPRGK